MSSSINTPTHFIRNIIDQNKRGVTTRFPPEPNGYLHIGHAKSICLNFGLAEDYNGRCHLRFDDTNPHKENAEFIEAIKRDVTWLGYTWGGEPRFASDYFEQLYQYAVELIKKNKAYVCDLSAEETRVYRGTLTERGKDSPYRNRSIDENLDLFARMRAGKFTDGQCVLRAKIDMAAPNINLRDPAIYRIRHGVIHHQTGEAWCMYPMYDFTHCLSDAIEAITYSLCTLEFEDHRPLYDWFLDTLAVPCHPQQIEFSRLELQYTITSKRKLSQLVDEGVVANWDDPRMPTIAGLRRRGFTPASLRDFCRRIGVTKSENNVEMSVLESCIREDLNDNAPRRMAVLHPLKVVLTNYDEDKTEKISAANHPQKEEMGQRTVPFSRELYIDREDFREEAPKKFKRLVIGGEVRLRNAYVIRCDMVVKDAEGEIIELHCSYDPDTLGKTPEGRKVKGVIHWVSAADAIPAEIRLYDRLFTQAHPDANSLEGNFLDYLNPDSLRTLTHCFVEASLASAQVEDHFQFEREGYFTVDPDHHQGQLVFNRTVTLRDSWAKIEKTG
ncbi:MAG: glutamine--tRNA ligase/YqeY domain fusion protein [Gammaproteobacteria bacterium]|nr:glutamine--tRNA ligase/YqeY domain fusion protein [Gammaproteobacteria bacterium]